MSRATGDATPAVAHIVETWLGLTETFIHEYVAAFRRVRPVVIARRVENLERFPLPAGAALHLSPPRRGTAAWARAAVERRLRGGDPHLQSILVREGVRLMHAHFGPTACSLFEVRRITRLPLVVSFYGYDASMTEVVREYAGRYRRLFDIGDAFLVEGPAMKTKLETLGCPSSKLRIQRIGIDPSRYRFRAREGNGDGPVTLLLCGRMVEKKGIPVALEALAEARRRDRRLRLRVVGDGPGRAEVERLIASLDLADAVTLLGSRSRRELLDEMERADLYLQPSRTAADGDSEGGAPTTLLEAQACGLPILTTRHADIPSVVREGDTALLADESDVGGLAANIERLARAPGQWASMGRAGRALVEERHDVSRQATDLEILYATLAETGRLDAVPQPR